MVETIRYIQRNRISAIARGFNLGKSWIVETHYVQMVETIRYIQRNRISAIARGFNLGKSWIVETHYVQMVETIRMFKEVGFSHSPRF